MDRAFVRCLSGRVERRRRGSSVGGRVTRQRFEQGSVVWGPVSGAARGSARVGPPWQLRGALILMGTNRTVLYPFFFVCVQNITCTYFFFLLKQKKKVEALFTLILKKMCSRFMIINLKIKREHTLH